MLAGGGLLSERACRAALRAVVAAVRAQHSEDSDGRRTGQADGLGCTLTAAQGMVGRVEGVRWSVLVPGRRIVFHPPAVAASRGRTASLPNSTRDRRGVAVVVEAAR
jgi:hypothetical protein